MEFKREQYLQKLVNRMHNGLIKVVTGIRRCGKSYLLFNIFSKYLQGLGVSSEHIISMAFDIRQNKQYRSADMLLEYIDSKIVDKDMYYIILDEVQMLEDFEEVLNTLLHRNNVDVYVTGSNSRFLSKDILTEFRGRGDEVHIYPLTFKEYLEGYNGDMYHAWADYIVYGGLPLVALMKTEEQKVNYLQSLFSTTYLRDIVDRYGISKTQEMENLIDILASSIGSLTNPPKIEATFKSVLKSTVSMNTIRQYIEYLEDAFVINKTLRYNVKGRKYIGTPVKYYFEDIGLRNARLGFRQVEENHLMENIIYNELRSRGYAVDIGIIDTRVLTEDGKMGRKQLEIDFVANLGSKRYYIQSAFSMPDEAKLVQEKASLLKLDDSFKKIIVVKDVVKVTCDENGITTMSIFDFLLKENSLEL